MYSVFVSEGLSNARRQTIAAVTVAATAFCLFSLNSFFLPFYKKCARPHPFSFGTATKRPTDRPYEQTKTRAFTTSKRRAFQVSALFVKVAVIFWLLLLLLLLLCYTPKFVGLFKPPRVCFVLPQCWTINVWMNYAFLCWCFEGVPPEKNQIESSSQKIKKNVIKRLKKWRRRALLPFCAVMTKIVVNIVAVFCFTLFLL